MKNSKLKKNIITVCSWIVLSLVLQFSVLAVLNKYYSKGLKLDIKKEEVTNKEEKVLKFNIDEDAEDIQVSSTGNYISYVSSGNMKVLNTNENEVNTIPLERDIENYFFKWNDEEDKMVIIENNIPKNKKGIKFYIYNPKDNLMQPALDFENNSRIYTLAKEGMKIEDVQLNNLNTIVYFKAEFNKNTKYLYRLDISDRAIKLPIKHSNIGDFYIIRQSDEILYEDLQSKKYYLTQKSKSEELVMPSKQGDFSVLGIDSDDNIYIAELQGDEIINIYKKDIYKNKNNNENWEKLDLNTKVNENEIIVENNKLYSIDKSNSEVIELISGKNIECDGEFIKITRSKLISKKDIEIIVKMLN